MRIFYPLIIASTAIIGCKLATNKPSASQGSPEKNDGASLTSSSTTYTSTGTTTTTYPTTTTATTYPTTTTTTTTSPTTTGTQPTPLNPPLLTGPTSTPPGGTTGSSFIKKTTSFTISTIAFIEGAKLDCVDFAWSFGIGHYLTAFAFCETTAASFSETTFGPSSRLKELFQIRAVCSSADNGKTWALDASSGISVKPDCYMGPETIGPPSLGVVVSNGVLGNCVATMAGGSFNASTDGQPDWKGDFLINEVKIRMCSAIQVGLADGHVGCTRPDGVASLVAQTSGTNFPSLGWKIQRTDPGGAQDYAVKVYSQLKMQNLWDCVGVGNMRSSTKGLIKLD